MTKPTMKYMHGNLVSVGADEEVDCKDLVFDPEHGVWQGETTTILDDVSDSYVTAEEAKAYYTASKTHWPPNHINCRSSLQEVTLSEALPVFEGGFDSPNAALTAYQTSLNSQFGAGVMHGHGIFKMFSGA